MAGQYWVVCRPIYSMQLKRLPSWASSMILQEHFSIVFLFAFPQLGANLGCKIHHRTVCFCSWLTCLISKIFRQEAIMSCSLENYAQLTIRWCQTMCERRFGLRCVWVGGGSGGPVEETFSNNGAKAKRRESSKMKHLFSQNVQLEMQMCQSNRKDSLLSLMRSAWNISHQTRILITIR